MEQSIAVKCFLAVARLGSYTAAASELFMTRQAVSKQVLRLEHALGVELFARTTKSVEITPAGRLFAEYYLEQQERFQAVCRQVSQISGESAAIRIGYLYGIEIDTPLYEVIRAYRRTHSLPPLQWQRGNPRDLVQDVENRSLDIAVTFTKDETRRIEPLYVQSIAEVRMVVAVSRENPVAAAARCAGDLEGETFYAWMKRPENREQEREDIIRHGRELGLNIRNVELLDSRETVKTVVEMGSGAALCTELDSICMSPHTRVFPLDSVNELGCVCRRDASEAVRNLAEQLTKMRL